LVKLILNAASILHRVLFDTVSRPLLSVIMQIRCIIPLLYLQHHFCIYSARRPV